MMIRVASEQDLAWLQANDHHVSAEELVHLISQQRVLVCETEGGPAAWLRWNLFWDNTPFMNMLYVLEGERSKGIGTQLVHYWEKLMRKQRYASVLTSTQANETAQHFYRKLGYRDAGSLILPGEPLEIIFHKDLDCE